MILPHMLPLADISTSVPSLVFDTGVFAKFILLLLFTISVISWAVIWDRSRLYLRLRKGGALASRTLKESGLEFALASVKSFLPSIEGAVLMEAGRLVKSNKVGIKKAADPSLTSEIPQEVRDHLERRAIEEFSEMEKYLVFLATTSGVSPFLGLLGTVWGIMSSFLSMGIHQTASLEVVGPGIAEALITTIGGLGAAIPALVGYNILARHVRRQETRIDVFISRILDSLEMVPAAASRVESGDSYQEHWVRQHT